MTRVGTCSGCGAQFRVPDTFTGPRAKCPKCGGEMRIAVAGEGPQAPAPGRGEPAGAARAGARPRVQAEPPPKKKLQPLWMLLSASGALLVVLVFATSRKKKEEPRLAAAPGRSASEAPPRPAPPPVVPPPVAAKPTADAPASAPASKSPKIIPKPTLEGPVPDVDLSKIADVPEEPGTPPELTAEIKQQLATMVDPDSGAKGTRAMLRLKAIGKPAFPQIINQLRRFDYTKPEDVSAGYFVNRLLEDMTGGKNAQFRNKLDPESVKWNRQVARVWVEGFLRSKDNPELWKLFTAPPSNLVKPPEELEGLGDPPPK